MGRKSARPKRGRIRIFNETPMRRKAEEAPSSEYTGVGRRTPKVAISQRKAMPEDLMHLAGAAMIAEIALRRAEGAQELALAQACADRMSSRGRIALPQRGAAAD